MERLYTVGVYGWEPESFFDRLEEAKIDLFLDIRRRRGVRGREYAFANAARLQAELERRGIVYRHLLALAPENATRALQTREDQAQGVARRKREALGEAFVDDYTSRTMAPFDWDELIDELQTVQRPVLFCVERSPEACHRGLVARRLAQETGVPVTDLMP
jgi:uncharacterized protein (DUF488 family)